MEYLKHLKEQPIQPRDIGVNLKSKLFEEAIDAVVENEKPLYIIECGANNGEGSTAVFAKYGIPVYSCEANLKRFEEATSFHKEKEHVKIDHAFSVKNTDGDPIYLRQIEKRGHAAKSQNWLERILKRLHKSKKDGNIMIFLDTHWTMGFVEFCVFLNFWLDNDLDYDIILVLDDVTNLKHRPAVLFLETHPELEIEKFFAERWGIFRFPKK